MPAPHSVESQAHGRVNLLGEHTDYNDGLVLPAAIPQSTRIELDFRDDRRVSALSGSVDAARPCGYTLGSEARGRGWLDYVQGVTWALAERGLPLRGFDLRISSQVPVGSGLSSSAALLVALLRGLRAGLGFELPELELARLSQRIENEFVGAPVGILDPVACTLCEPGRALYLDTRSLRYEQLPLPRALELLIIHSGVRHSLAAAHDAPTQRSYRVRRAECEAAAQRLGVKSLRDLELHPEALGQVAALEPPLERRVRHVLSENERVRAAVRILKGGATREADLADLGRLFQESHRSQRNDYGVSIPEVDRLVEIGADDPDIINRGARLTGGGFGGSVVMLARAGAARAAARRIVARYQKETGRTPTILTPL